MSEDTNAAKEIIVVHGDVCIRKERKKRHKMLLSELLYEFSRSTTLHGLRYITEQGLSIIEKTFWFVTFVTSLGACIYLIRNVYDKWQSTPVIVTISEKLVPAINIPFPSVTICPQSKSRASVYNYSEYRYKVSDWLDRSHNVDIHNLTDESWFEKYVDVGMVCNNDLTEILQTRVFDIGPRNHLLVHHLEEVAERLDDVLIRCRWRSNAWVKCSDYFKKALTQEGICFNMNSLAASEILNLDNIHDKYEYLAEDSNSKILGWDPYMGYVDGNISAYPRRGRMNGASPDLDILLKTNIEDRDNACNTINKGYKIYLQHPADLPRTSMYYFAALEDQMSALPVKCNILNTSASLKQKTAQERKCYFEGEKKQDYFKMYTENNCWSECLSKYALKKCNCVGFFMPHNTSDRLCDLAKQNSCLLEAEDELADMESLSNDSEDYVKCDCLPTCYSIDYDAQVLKTDFEFGRLLFEDFNIDNHKKYSYSRIVVFFQFSNYVSTRRSELFGRTDFIANCGGLLGLFLGFSVLSIVEIIYFITIRLWCALRRDLKKENKSLKASSKNA